MFIAYIQLLYNIELRKMLSLSPPPSPSLSLPHSLQEAIFRVVASILHIGNIEFTKGKEVDSSVPKDDKAKFHLKMTAELLMYE